LYVYNGLEFSDDCPAEGSPSPDLTGEYVLS
jgi:hypothetical protein